MDCTEEEYENRETPEVPAAALLSALSVLWAYPKDGVDAYRRALMDESLNEINGLSGENLLEQFNAYEKSEETIMGSSALELDYTRLFIGSLKMYAPPYASYYIDGDNLLYGPTAAEIDALYAQFGVEIKRDEHDMPDHIRFLLAFMSMLAAAFEKTGKRDYALAYADFKSEYFDSWIQDFRDKIYENTQYPYFKALIDFTIEAVQGNEE